MIMTFSPRCETSVAVEWGSPALQAKADEVVHGDGPRAVAAYIRHVLKETRLPLDRIGRHRIILGTSEDGRPASGAINGRNILVVGETQSGKSSAEQAQPCTSWYDSSPSRAIAGGPGVELLSSASFTALPLTVSCFSCIQ